MHVDIRIGAVVDPPLWPELNPEPAELVGVGILEKGMESGSCSAALFFRTRDGKAHIAQLSASMLRAIGCAAQGAKERFNDHDK